MSKASIAALRKDLQAVSEKLKANAGSAIEAAAQELAGAIRSRAPIKSGKLAKSVQAVEVRPGRWRVQAGGDLTTKEARAGGTTYSREVKIGSGDTAGIAKKKGGKGVTYDYARAQEFGTVNEPAHPFFFNTYRAKKNGIKRRVKQAMQDGVSK